jgi:putative chitinase
LGNIYKGDGSRFRGHGLIQTTGRFNHRRVTQRLRARFPTLLVPDFEAEPKLLTLPRWAALSAADYWDMINGNQMADAGQFKLLTRRINGGYNGLADRLKLWESFKKAL